MSYVQEPIHPANMLENALNTFDALPQDQKDKMIARYEGKKEDFPAA